MQVFIIYKICIKIDSYKVHEIVMLNYKKHIVIKLKY